jgi:hypothetical protein
MLVSSPPVCSITLVLDGFCPRGVDIVEELTTAVAACVRLVHSGPKFWFHCSKGSRAPFAFNNQMFALARHGVFSSSFNKLSSTLTNHVTPLQRGETAAVETRPAVPQLRSFDALLSEIVDSCLGEGAAIGPGEVATSIEEHRRLLEGVQQHGGS